MSFGWNKASRLVYDIFYLPSIYPNLTTKKCILENKGDGNVFYLQT